MKPNIGVKRNLESAVSSLFNVTVRLETAVFGNDKSVEATEKTPPSRRFVRAVDDIEEIADRLVSVSNELESV